MATTIKFPKSDSFAFFVTINKISHLLDNAFFTVKENPNEEPVLQKKLGAGISLVDNRIYKNQLSYKVQIDGADTQFMVVGTRYFFDVKGTIGNAQKTFLWGELILSETETGYINPAIQGDTVAIAETYTATFETGPQSQFVEYEADPVAMAKIGDMSTLTTTQKGTVVKAINEVNAPTFTKAANLENVVSGEKQSTLWGKVKKWFSSFKALAFKDKVGTADINDGAVTSAKIGTGAVTAAKISSGAVTTEKFDADAKCPKAGVADSVLSVLSTDFTTAEWKSAAYDGGSNILGTYSDFVQGSTVIGGVYQVKGSLVSVGDRVYFTGFVVLESGNIANAVIYSNIQGIKYNSTKVYTVYVNFDLSSRLEQARFSIIQRSELKSSDSTRVNQTSISQLSSIDSFNPVLYYRKIR